MPRVKARPVRWGGTPHQDGVGPTPKGGVSHRDCVRPAPSGAGSEVELALRRLIPGPVPGPSRVTWPEEWSNIVASLRKVPAGVFGSSSQDSRPIGRPLKARVAGGSLVDEEIHVNVVFNVHIIDDYLDRYLTLPHLTIPHHTIPYLTTAQAPSTPHDRLSPRPQVRSTDRVHQKQQ